MVASHDAKADDVALVIEDLEPLGAALGGEAGDDVNLAEAANADVAAVDDAAALDEVLVPLRVVEPTDHGPDGCDGSRDLLDYGGVALVGPHCVNMVSRDAVGDLRGARDGLPPLELLLADRGGRGRVVDSVEQKRRFRRIRRHFLERKL
ncbi:hypothetical protein JRO89_XS12G0073600 [Xanthoceras sorbifolium]|uniref:Uncharacterized protein n=1 Tax=Xanthoceras sorbifolium TaxID=99658 RepID=A0ABQ8HBP6_9ROSI|nr:hypothetical protein JRO89_XS12G0073600 [Xanthoceras sorbifolium]